MEIVFKKNGDAGIRTRGLLHAKQTLYRLSYIPLYERVFLKLE